MNPHHAEIERRLASGTRIDRVADLVGVDRRTVVGVAHAAGFRIRNDGTAERIEGHAMTTTAAVPTAPSVRPAHRSTLGEVALAVNELTRHRDTRIKKQAERTIVQVRRLIDALAEYDDKAHARAEIERLEQQLREAKRKLRGTPPSRRSDVAADPKTIRAWASDNGVDCPARGRVPQAVVDAYTAAQGAAA